MTDKMKQADEQLGQSRREIIEAEQVASHTLARLREQRETLQRSKSRLDEVNKDLKDSNATVDRMASNCVIL